MLYAVSAPPKKSTSVARNAHIPSAAASFCCSRSSKWWASGVRAGSVSDGPLWPSLTLPALTCRLVPGASDIFGLLDRVNVRLRRDGRRLGEVVRRRRGGRLPFEAGRAPRVAPRGTAVLE